MQDLVVRDLEVDTYNDGDTVTTDHSPIIWVCKDWLMVGKAVSISTSDQPWWGWISSPYQAMRLDENGRLFPSDYDMPIAFTALGLTTRQRLKCLQDANHQWSTIHSILWCICSEQYFTAQEAT